MSVVVWLVLAVQAGPMERGLPGLAARQLSETLERADRPNLHTRLGSALARTGHPADADVSFSLGPGSPHYLHEGYLDHANALRTLGRCTEAATVRLEGRWDATGSAELLLLSEAVLDHAACGQWADAEAVALQGLALDPDAPAMNAAYAVVLRAAGQDVAADQHLALALEEAEHRLALRPWLIAAEHRLDTGDVVGAGQMLDRAMAITFRHPDLTWLRVWHLVATDAWTEAAALLRHKPWVEHEDPRLLAAKAVVFSRVGDPAAAAEARRVAKLRYGRVRAFP